VGLIEMWIEDPDGVPIVLVEVPADHPLRRDPRHRQRDPKAVNHMRHERASRGQAIMNKYATRLGLPGVDGSGWNSSCASI